MKKPRKIAVVRNISEVVTPVSAASRQRDLARCKGAAVAIEGGRVTAVGPERAIVKAAGRGFEEIDARGNAVIPGLVECHAHLLFGGSRVGDFEKRSEGLTYAGIAASGGGIATTVAATRKASRKSLFDQGIERLNSFMTRGVTTVEIKSGYGLDTASELRILETVRRLSISHPATIVPTFLGAHTVPHEFKGDRDGYIRLLIDEMIPMVARRGLARFCDVFCDSGAFTADEARRILEAGARHGLKPKIHADQLTSCGGAELACALHAVSADHLDRVSEGGIDALRRSGTVAVLLPASSIFIGSLKLAPARKLIDAGVPVAISTDYNPGSSNTRDLALAGTLACTLMRMTPAEALCAVTKNAAKALAMESERGTIEAGKAADIVILKSRDYRDLFYCMGENLAGTVIKDGIILLTSAGVKRGFITD